MMICYDDPSYKATIHLTIGFASLYHQLTILILSNGVFNFLLHNEEAYLRLVGIMLVFAGKDLGLLKSFPRKQYNTDSF